MLHEFDQWLERKYLSKKARKDRWAWNFGIQQRRPITVRENRQWKPAVAYCRYADDFVVIVKGTKAHAEAIREECRAFLEDELKLTLNMGKTRITHVNDGFVFLGHRIIRKAGPAWHDASGHDDTQGEAAKLRGNAGGAALRQLRCEQD